MKTFKDYCPDPVVVKEDNPPEGYAVLSVDTAAKDHFVEIMERDYGRTYTFKTANGIKGEMTAKMMHDLVYEDMKDFPPIPEALLAKYINK